MLQHVGEFLGHFPDWLAKILPAVGWVGWAVNWFLSRRQRAADLRAARRERLIELRSLLRQTRSSFDSQVRLRDELFRKLEERNPEDTMRRRQGRSPAEGYEHYFYRMAPEFNQDEKELHAIIRSITISSLRPGNVALRTWIARDNYFKLEHPEEPSLTGLASCINELQAHLELWIAKYKAWIESDPAHALVYLADEEQQGKRFPEEIDARVDEALQHF